MIKKKILFMGRVDCEVTSSILRTLKKNFSSVNVFLNKDINSKPGKSILNWKGDYIFCFRSFYILKKKLIDNTKEFAINFHPGPPEYRGIGCVNFALLNKETKYGCTAHIIDQKVDYGKIINVMRFKILNKDSVESILKKTYKTQFKQFNTILRDILTNSLNKTISKNNSIEKWSKKKYKRNQMLKLYNIPRNVDKKKLEILIRATNTNKFKPFIKLNDKKFYLFD